MWWKMVWIALLSSFVVCSRCCLRLGAMVKACRRLLGRKIWVCRRHRRRGWRGSGGRLMEDDNLAVRVADVVLCVSERGQHRLMFRSDPGLLPRGSLPFLDVGERSSPTQPRGFVPPSHLSPQSLNVTLLAFVLEALTTMSSRPFARFAFVFWAGSGVFPRGAAAIVFGVVLRLFFLKLCFFCSSLVLVNLALVGVVGARRFSTRGSTGLVNVPWQLSVAWSRPSLCGCGGGSGASSGGVDKGVTGANAPSGCALTSFGGGRSC